MLRILVQFLRSIFLTNESTLISDRNWADVYANCVHSHQDFYNFIPRSLNFPHFFPGIASTLYLYIYKEKTPVAFLRLMNDHIFQKNFPHVFSFNERSTLSFNKSWDRALRNFTTCCKTRPLNRNVILQDRESGIGSSGDNNHKNSRYPRVLGDKHKQARTVIA